MQVTKLKSNIDLLLVGVLALISLLLIALVPSSILRIVLGLPLVLFYPGYIIALAVFPERKSITGIERAVMTLVFSIVAMSLIGLALNYSPWGIKLSPLVIAVALLVFASTAAAWYRRERLEERKRFRPGFTLNLAFWQRYGRTERALTVAFIFVLIAALGILVYYLATPKVSEPFTEFYILGPDGKMIDYPLELKAGDTATINLVIVNHEHKTAEYQVKMKMEGVEQREAGPIRLGPEEKWQREVSFTPTQSGRQTVEFLLYKQGQSGIYRDIYLQVDVE
jgi:uncharacterized membrane protein